MIARATGPGRKSAATRIRIERKGTQRSTSTMRIRTASVTPPK
jgi:hypothetical protein